MSDYTPTEDARAVQESHPGPTPNPHRIEAGEPGWMTREVKRAKDRLAEIPPQARPVVTGGYFAGLHEAGDSDG